MKKIVIINYGMGNVASVLNALLAAGIEAEISDDHEKIGTADKLILPGVGAFEDGMKNISKKGLRSILEEAVLIEQKPILGICLGMQLMCDRSFEFGDFIGLQWIKASVKPLNEKIDIRVPHMGWNNIAVMKQCCLFDGLPADDFYFVHSFYVDCENKDFEIAQCSYGIDFCCAFQKENIFGVQFHPEKSQAAGLTLLKNFARF